MLVNYLTDQKHFTGHMFNKKLEEKSHKMSFKLLPVKKQQSKNQQEGGAQCGHPLPPPGQLVLNMNFILLLTGVNSLITVNVFMTCL